MVLPSIRIENGSMGVGSKQRAVHRVGKVEEKYVRVIRLNEDREAEAVGRDIEES